MWCVCMLHVWNCVIDFCGTKQINRSGHLAWIWGWHTLFFCNPISVLCVGSSRKCTLSMLEHFRLRRVIVVFIRVNFQYFGCELVCFVMRIDFCVLWVCSEEYSLENTTVQFAFQFSTDLDWCGDGEGKENERPTSQCALRYASYAGSGVTGLEKMELYVVNTE